MLNSSVHAASTAVEHHRQVLRPAARHHGIDRDLLDRALDEIGRNDGDEVLRIARSSRRACARRVRAWAARAAARRSSRVRTSPRLVLGGAELDTACLQSTVRVRATVRASCTSGSCVRDPQPGRHSGRSVPSGRAPVIASQRSRRQPSVRPTTSPPSTRSTVGTVSMSSANEISSDVSSTRARPKVRIVLRVDGERSGAALELVEQRGDQLARRARALDDDDDPVGEHVLSLAEVHPSLQCAFGCMTPGSSTST